MDKPLLLDAYCGGGGIAEGYHRAGFRIVGCDNKPQPHYPFSFILGDAIEVIRRIGSRFAAIHGSPPCHKWSALAMLHQEREYPDLVGETRTAMQETGRPYIIENVPKAPLIDPVMLCGTMFGLQTLHGSQLRRHRIFEVPWMTDHATPPCSHIQGVSAIGVHGGGQHPARRRVPATISVVGNAGGISHRDGTQLFSSTDRQDAMGIDWMGGKALSQAIPPAYSEWIGVRLMAYLKEHGKA